MAHTAPPTPSRRRIEFAFGVVLLLAGALVAILAVVALNSPQGQQAAGASETHPLNTPRVPASSTAAKPPAATSTSAGPSGSAGSTDGAGSASGGGKLPLIVLNNTSDTPGSVAADRFENAGWTVTDISTFTGAILSTAAYYDPAVAGAAAAAEELRREFPAIHRVKQKFQGLPEGPIVIVLTSDYS